jgi:putative peptidoglycan lipid II flippase
MFVYLFFIGVSALFAAVLNSLGVFGAPSFTPVLLNLTIIAAAAFLSKSFKDPAFAFAIGTIVGGFLQMVFLIPFAKKRGWKIKPVIDMKQKELRTIARRMLPGILAVGVQQFNVLVSTRISSTLEEGAIASLYHANRLEEFTLGIFAISIATVILPMLSRYAAENQIDKLKESLTFSLRVTMLITIPATVGMVILREPIIRILFMRGEFDKRSLYLTMNALLYYVLGLAVIAGSKIVAPAFFSLKDVKTPVYISVVTVGINLIGCIVLKEPLKNGGIALAATISAFVNIGLLLYIFQKRYGNLNNALLRLTIFRTTVASLIMGIPIFIINSKLNAFENYRLLMQLAFLFGTILLAILLYTLGLWIMRSHELKELMYLVKRRSDRKAGKE